MVIIINFGISYANIVFGATVANALTTAAIQSLATTGTAMYIQSQGTQPQYVVTPYGSYILLNSNKQNQQQNNNVNEYVDQNQQSEKQAFLYQ